MVDGQIHGVTRPRIAPRLGTEPADFDGGTAEDAVDDVPYLIKSRLTMA